MHQAIQQFIGDRCHQHAVIKCPVKAFVSAFRLSLPPEQRRAWPRTSVVTELSQSYRIDVDPQSMRFTIHGLALLPAGSHLLPAAG
jgi:hypothetical protein